MRRRDAGGRTHCGVRGDVHRVGAGSFGDAGDGDRILDGLTALLVHLPGVEAQPDRHGVADLGTHRGQHLDEEPGPAGDVAAPRIVTVVGGGGEERVDEVAVARVDLDRVEPGVTEADGRGRVPCDDRGQVVVGGDVMRERRRRPGERFGHCRHLVGRDHARERVHLEATGP
ncbi:MAG: hypothetical protein V9G12_10815 [Microthrixaceae bacterium]